jgi:hypothetical protein
VWLVPLECQQGDETQQVRKIIIIFGLESYRESVTRIKVQMLLAANAWGKMYTFIRFHRLGEVEID